MHAIRKESWGFRLDFSGYISTSEMQEWKEASEKALRPAPRAGFGVLVDMKALKPLATETQQIMVAGQQLYSKAGMGRSAVVVDSSITALQFKRLAKESGIYSFERYFSSQESGYEQKALAWLKDAVDPDA